MILNSIVIRPVQRKDLNDIFKLSMEAKPGLTSLSKDKHQLESMINSSLQSFNSTVKSPESEFYFFVCEDLISNKIVGTCGIFSQVGVETPFYSYRVETEEKTSSILSEPVLVTRLHPEITHHGPSEIGTLFLS